MNKARPKRKCSSWLCPYKPQISSDRTGGMVTSGIGGGNGGKVIRKREKETMIKYVPPLD